MSIIQLNVGVPEAIAILHPIRIACKAFECVLGPLEQTIHGPVLCLRNEFLRGGGFLKGKDRVYACVCLFRRFYSACIVRCIRLCHYYQGEHNNSEEPEKRKKTKD